MFIAHGNKVRKHARWIMAGVLLFLIPSFVMLFTQSREADRGGGELPIVRGKPVNAAEFEQMKDLVRAQYVVLRGRDLARSAQMRDQIKQEAVIQMLLLEQAEAMGVVVSEPELESAFLSQPVFQNSAGQFDRERLQQFLIVLNNSGVSEGMFGEVLRQRLIIEKLQALVASGAKATPTAVLQAYQPLHESLTVDLVEFAVADHHEPVVVSNELVRTFYEQNQESFRLPAKIKVQYAAFTAAAAKPGLQLTDDEITDFYTRNQFRYAGTNTVPLTLEAVKPQVQADLLNLRADRAAADRATEFGVKLAQQTKPDFAKVCAEFGVTPVTTDYISAFEPVPGITNFPDFAAQAHHLSPSQPISDPLGTSNTYYVLEFIDAKPSLIPPFDEVQTEATDQVKRLRTYAATLQRAEKIITELKELITAGKTFAQACAELKLKIETPPPFTVADEKVTLPGGGRIQQASLAMPVGAVSDLIGTATGGLVFHLRDRQPADVAAFEKDREMIARQILQRDRSALFNDWIQALVHAEQVDFKLPLRQADEDEPPAAN